MFPTDLFVLESDQSSLAGLSTRIGYHTEARGIPESVTSCQVQHGEEMSWRKVDNQIYMILQNIMTTLIGYI
jgi:hypothetical protein